MADVFISCNGHSANEIAERVADVLEESGITCWYAKRDMGPNEFAGVITRAIRNCKIFLLILDGKTLHSAHISSEILLAMRRVVNYENLRLLAFQVDAPNVQVTGAMPLMYQFQAIDGTPPDAEHIGELVRRVALLLNREPAAARLSEQP